MANDIFGPNVSSTNSLKTLNGKLGNGCVFGAAKTKGTKARIMHSLVINEQAVTMEVKRIKREQCAYEGESKRAKGHCKSVKEWKTVQN